MTSNFYINLQELRYQNVPNGPHRSLTSTLLRLVQLWQCSSQCVHHLTCYDHVAIIDATNFTCQFFNDTNYCGLDDFWHCLHLNTSCNLCAEAEPAKTDWQNMTKSYTIVQNCLVSKLCRALSVTARLKLTERTHCWKEQIKSSLHLWSIGLLTGSYVNIRKIAMV